MKYSSRFLWLAFFALLFLAGCATVETHNQTKPAPARSNPNIKQKAYEDLLFYHRNEQQRLLDSHLLVFSWFPKGEKLMHMMCVVDSYGKVFIYKNINSMPAGPRQEFVMKENAFSQLKQALDEVTPPPETKPPAGSIIFSYRNRAAWETCEYSWKTQPPALKKIYDLLELAKIIK